MRLTTKLSVFVTFCCAMTTFLVLLGSALSFFWLSYQKDEKHIHTVVFLVDQGLRTHTPPQLERWLQTLIMPTEILRLEFYDGKHHYLTERAVQDIPRGLRGRDITKSYRLIKNPEFTLRITWVNTVASYTRFFTFLIPVGLAILLMAPVLLLMNRGLRRYTGGLEKLEQQAAAILNGDRRALAASTGEWPATIRQALNVLLNENRAAAGQISRLDKLIRSYTAQDDLTGLNNRLFFDSQLTAQLEDPENPGVHGILMMIRLPDFDALFDRWSQEEIAAYVEQIVTLLSTYITCYPAALLARYYHSDFVALLPHRTLKDAQNIAAQLLNGLDALSSVCINDKNDMMHIGICAYRAGDTPESVLSRVETATRSAVLQGGNSWAIWREHEQQADPAGGSVKWRTLLERTLANGDLRLYQKPALTEEGRIHHREISVRIPDEDQERAEAEFMMRARQLGLADAFYQQLILRVIDLLKLWPRETMAVPIMADTLLSPVFQRWLRDILLQSEKSLRRRIMFELDEEDACQQLERLTLALRMITLMECKVAIINAGLTVVSTDYIKQLPIEIIKLHPGLVRKIDKRAGNQIFVQSLTEACKGTVTHVFATGVRSEQEWLTLLSKGVQGGQGDFFAPLRRVRTPNPNHMTSA